MSGDDLVHRGRRAAVGRMGHLDTGGADEQLHGDVLRTADAAGRIVDAARLLAR
jgi:hypothetical protein